MSADTEIVPIINSPNESPTPIRILFMFQILCPEATRGESLECHGEWTERPPEALRDRTRFRNARRADRRRSFGLALRREAVTDRADVEPGRASEIGFDAFGDPTSVRMR